MNYKSAYNSLIDKYRNNPPSGYSEKYHIIPRCMGGTNDPSNLIRLPAKAHFVAHLMLAKIYGGRLWHAAHWMSNNGRYGARQYEYIKRNHAVNISKVNKGRKLSKRHIAKLLKINKGKKFSEERKREMSRARKGIRPSEECFRKSIEALKGSTHNKGRKHTIEARLNMIMGQIGKVLTPEHKANIGKSSKKAWAKRKQSLIQTKE